VAAGEETERKRKKQWRRCVKMHGKEDNGGTWRRCRVYDVSPALP
jgi:hypothetical protein